MTYASSELQVKLILKLPLLYNYEAGGRVAGAGDDCADMTCCNPGSLKLPVIHRSDCAGTKFTVRVIRKIPVPVFK
jgi:hypothetical protein